MSEEIYKMNLHDVIEVKDYLILRVPGGWVYQHLRLDSQAMTAIFVPWDNEFQQE